MTMCCGRGIHDGGVRLHPGSSYYATYGTGGKTDTRMAAYPFDLPSVCQGVDIQDTLVFRKPYGGLDWRPIPFETLQVEIPLCRKGGEMVVMHGNAFMIDAGSMEPSWRWGWEVSSATRSPTQHGSSRGAIQPVMTLRWHTSLSRENRPMSNQYVGTWRIVEMEQWDQDYIDLVVPGYIVFRKDNLGEFQFGTVHGEIDYRIEPYQDTERLEFSWEGEDEMDPVSGRGWAIITDGQIQGRIYFHEGDESGFMAEK